VRLGKCAELWKQLHKTIRNFILILQRGSSPWEKLSIQESVGLSMHTTNTSHKQTCEPNFVPNHALLISYSIFQIFEFIDPVKKFGILSNSVNLVVSALVCYSMQGTEVWGWKACQGWGFGLGMCEMQSHHPQTF
jgi:hypothetical protein